MQAEPNPKIHIKFGITDLFIYLCSPKLSFPDFG